MSATGASGGRPNLARKRTDILSAESFRISGENCFGNLGRFTRVLSQQGQQGFRETGDVPEPDVRLVAPGIATAGVDGTEDALRVEGVHERARPIVDGLTRDRGVVGVHHPVDEAERHPLGDQVRLGSGDRLEQGRIGIGRCSGVRVMPGNHMIGEQPQGIDIVARQKILKSSDANVTCGNAGEYAARERACPGA